MHAAVHAPIDAWVLLTSGKVPAVWTPPKQKSADRRGTATDRPAQVTLCHRCVGNHVRDMVLTMRLVADRKPLPHRRAKPLVPALADELGPRGRRTASRALLDLLVLLSLPTKRRTFSNTRPVPRSADAARTIAHSRQAAARADLLASPIQIWRQIWSCSDPARNVLPLFAVSSQNTLSARSFVPKASYCAKFS